MGGQTYNAECERVRQAHVAALDTGVTSPQIHAQPVDYLLREIERLRARNRKNQLRANKLRLSRDYWRKRAKRQRL